MWDEMVDVVKGWRPGPMATEREYRDSLYERLHKALGEDATIEKEYRHGGTTIDLYAKTEGFFGSKEAFIELKLNLTQKTQYDRLVGQVHGMKPSDHNVILVLIGRSDPALVKRLKDEFEDEMGGSFLGSTNLVIVQKK